MGRDELTKPSLETLMKTAALSLVALTMPASAYLVFEPVSPLFRGPMLNGFDRNSLRSSLVDLSTFGLLREALGQPWSPYTFSPFGHPRSSLDDLGLSGDFGLLRNPVGHPLSPYASPSSKRMVRHHTPHLHSSWADQGEQVEAKLAIPRGFGDTAITANLDVSDDGVQKVTVRGARPGMHFSRSVSLPFPVAEAEDIDLEHRPRDGIFTLRVRKPVDAQPPKPEIDLPIKRADESIPDTATAKPECPEVKTAAEQIPDTAMSETKTADDHMKHGQARHEATEEELQMSQLQQEQILDEKFAFVKQADAPTTTPQGQASAEEE